MNNKRRLLNLFGTRIALEARHAKTPSFRRGLECAVTRMASFSLPACQVTGLRLLAFGLVTGLGTMLLQAQNDVTYHLVASCGHSEKCGLGSCSVGSDDRASSFPAGQKKSVSVTDSWLGTSPEINTDWGGTSYAKGGCTYGANTLELWAFAGGTATHSGQLGIGVGGSSRVDGDAEFSATVKPTGGAFPLWLQAVQLKVRGSIRVEAKATGYCSASASGRWTASGGWSDAQGNFGDIQLNDQIDVGSSSTNNLDSRTLSQTFSLPVTLVSAGIRINKFVSLDALIKTGTDGSASAEAWVDPVVTLDQQAIDDYADQNGYPRFDLASAFEIVYPQELKDRTLSYEWDAGQLILRWGDTNAVLETAADTNMTWNVVAEAASPMAITTDQPFRFFRLRFDD